MQMGISHTVFSAIIMLLLISFLILIHELGHFMAAKFVGMRVDKFGFGLPIGPTLFSKKVGETEFLIHAFLLGGYVSFPDDEKDSELPMDSPQRFANKPVGQRAFVIAAGVIMNVVIAYILIFFTGMFWHKLPANSYTVSFVKYAPTAVESIQKADLKENDILYTINNLEIKFPIVISKIANLSKEFDGTVKQDIVDKKYEELKKLNPAFARDDKIPENKTVKLPNFTDEEAIVMTMDNIMGLEKYKSEEVKLTENQIALRDKINYKKTYKTEAETSLYDIAYAISDTKKPMTMVVLRDGEQIELTPFYSDKEGKLGIVQGIQENYQEIKSAKELFRETINYAYYTEKMMVYSLSKLFTGKIPASELNGIIAVAKIGTEIIAYKGIAQGILLTAMISLNLALMNILPIPALDGGHLLFLIIEKITGKPPKKEIVEKVSMFFFYLLILLMILILYNDIHAWIIGKI